MSRPAGPAATVLAAGGWIGLILFLAWQEFHLERWATAWWFRIPATAVLGLVVLVFALECLWGEMTARRWATSVLVFGVFGVLFLLAGIFGPAALGLPRWVLLAAGIHYLLAAGAAGVAGRDVC